jgi:NDP-sugar pyrophosphorylase family protein
MNTDLFFNEILVADFLKPYFEKEDWYLLPGKIKDILKENIKETEINSEIGNLIYHGNVYIGKNCVIGDNVVLDGPVYIGDNVEIATGAYIRAGSYIGNGCAIGHAAEIKAAIIMDKAKVANHCFCGDSIMGSKARMGGHSETANRKFDQTLISLNIDGNVFETNLDKYGAVIGEGSRLGGGVFTSPGTTIGMNTFISTLVQISGYVPSNKFVKMSSIPVIKDNSFSGELNNKSKIYE